MVHCRSEKGKLSILTNFHILTDTKIQELIKVRGFQVAPPELENVLLDHPHIIDAAVIGVKSAGGDSEYPRGYVVKRPGPEGEKLTHDDVHNHVNERLIHYKRLTGGVIFTDEVSFALSNY